MTGKIVNEDRVGAAKLHPIPLEYLHKGTRFVGIRSAPGATRTCISGVADMDGHMVSENYGFRQGNEYYCDPRRSYINVHLDGLEYEEWGRHINDGIYARDGWTIYVSLADHQRYLEDTSLNANYKADRTKTAKKVRLLEKIKAIRAEADKLEAEVNNI